VEIVVVGTPTATQKLQQSAEAVTVVDLARARRRTSDLAEQLARTQGLAVQRSAGLGSHMHLSLNGLYDAQIRTFVDGVPRELEMYPQELGDVPVNLLDRVEVYRGVVPIRFGADALGGAINLVHDRRLDTGAAGSYQVGAFGTLRATAAARFFDPEQGFVFRAASFLDHARNDYETEVNVADAQGQPYTTTAKRFHDGFQAQGASLELGLVEQAFADELSVRVFLSSYGKELQHDPHVFDGPYGEVEAGETRTGAALRYRKALFRKVNVDALFHYANRRIDLLDVGEWVYDWFGQKMRRRVVAGERDSVPHDRTERSHGFYGQASLAWAASSVFTFRANVTPRFTTRTGEERRVRTPGIRHPLTAERQLFTTVVAAELEANALSFSTPSRALTDDAGRARFGDSGSRDHKEGEDAPEVPAPARRLQNVLFTKAYFLNATHERGLPNGVFLSEERSERRFGVGNGTRFRFTPWLLAKVSYEFSTRLPQPDEVFGDGISVIPNLDLKPETAHNVNIGPRLELRRGPAGAWTAEINGVLRESDELIVLLVGNRTTRFENVFAARTLGLEGSLGWTSPGRLLSLDATGAYQDVRNRSDEGTFAEYSGDRLPNRPWLFASLGAQTHFRRVFAALDEVELFWAGRYTHRFFRTWESAGLTAFKPLVASQFGQNIGATYHVRSGPIRVWSTIEIQNVTDARLVDFFGIQRPGRAVYIKWSGEL
jgi:vitamin B12 transporter